MADELHIVTVYSAAGKPVFTTSAHNKPAAKAVASDLIANTTWRVAKVRVWTRDLPWDAVGEGWRETSGYAL